MRPVPTGVPHGAAARDECPQRRVRIADVESRERGGGEAAVRRVSRRVWCDGDAQVAQVRHDDATAHGEEVLEACREVRCVECPAAVQIAQDQVRGSM